MEHAAEDVGQHKNAAKPEAILNGKEIKCANDFKYLRPLIDNKP